VAAAAACVPSAPPDSFRKSCDADPSVCTAPLSCLQDTEQGATGKVCTKPCTTDTDCPEWTGSSICDVNESTCVQGVCGAGHCSFDM